MFSTNVMLKHENNFSLSKVINAALSITNNMNVQNIQGHERHEYEKLTTLPTGTLYITPNITTKSA